MDWQSWVRGGATVSLDEHRIWFRSEGKGPTLLFLHGYPTSSHDYDPVISVLRQRFRCVSFDFLGFGASAKPVIDYSYGIQHRALARVAAAAGIERAVVVAHDYAVTIAQDLLAGTPRAPFSLDGVVFLNGGLDPAQHRARPIQRLLATGVGRVLGPLVIRKRVTVRALRDVLVRKDCLAEDDVWAAIASHQGRRVMPRLLHYISERRARRDALVASLGERVTPKCLLWGMADPVSGAHVIESVRARLARASIHELHGVGHYPQLEAAAEVAALIAEAASAWSG